MYNFNSGEKMERIVNRQVALIRPKMPFLDWINKLPGQILMLRLNNYGMIVRYTLYRTLPHLKKDTNTLKSNITGYLRWNYGHGIQMNRIGRRKEIYKYSENGSI